MGGYVWVNILTFITPEGLSRRENGHVTEGLMEGVVTEVARLRDNSHITEVASLKEKWSCYGGHFNEKGNGHVTEVVTLMEEEWSCYRGGHFNGGRMVMLQFNGKRMVMLQRWPV